jgi:hypothetical protein
MGRLQVSVQARTLWPQPDALSEGCLRLLERAGGRSRPLIDEAQRRSTTLLDRGFGLSMAALPCCAEEGVEAGSAALRVDWPVYPRRAEHNTVAE